MVLREGTRGKAGVCVVILKIDLEVRCATLASFPEGAGHVEVAPADAGAFTNDSGSLP